MLYIYTREFYYLIVQLRNTHKIMEKSNLKKFVYAIMMAIVPVLAFSLSSCSDDDDLPNVNVSLEVENGTIVDGTIYVVQGDTLNVEGIKITNNEAGKGAAVTNVKYFVDGFYIGESLFAPYPAYNITDIDTPKGSYSLGITCTVLAVDKTVAQAVLNYPIKVVASAEDIPGAGASSAVKTVSLK